MDVVDTKQAKALELLINSPDLKTFVKKLEEAAEYAEDDTFKTLKREMNRLLHKFPSIKKGNYSLREDFWDIFSFSKRLKNKVRSFIINDTSNINELINVIKYAKFEKKYLKAIEKALAFRDASHVPTDYKLRSKFLHLVRKEKGYANKLYKNLHDLYKIGLKIYVPYVIKNNEAIITPFKDLNKKEKHILKRAKRRDIYELIRVIIKNLELKFFTYIKKQSKYKIHFVWAGEGGFILKEGNNLFLPTLNLNNKPYEINWLYLNKGSGIKRQLTADDGILIFNNKVNTKQAKGIGAFFPKDFNSHDPLYNILVWKFIGNFDEILFYDKKDVALFSKNGKEPYKNKDEFFTFIKNRVNKKVIKI